VRKGDCLGASELVISRGIRTYEALRDEDALVCFRLLAVVPSMSLINVLQQEDIQRTRESRSASTKETHICFPETRSSAIPWKSWRDNRNRQDQASPRKDPTILPRLCNSLVY
jgi:hypothetical protein